MLIMTAYGLIVIESPMTDMATCEATYQSQVPVITTYIEGKELKTT